MNDFTETTFYDLINRVEAANSISQTPFMIYEEWMLPQIKKYYNVDLIQDDQTERGIRFLKRKKGGIYV